MDTKKLRQRILDLAIRGKLVPQDPNDEPASVLLERIRAEKERLIAEGKIKRPKTKRSADTSHYQNFTPPFDIPDSWEWVRLDDIAYFGGGKTPSMEVKNYWQNATNLWVTSKDMKYPHIKDTKIKIADCALSQMTIYSAGTLLLVTRSGILRHSLPIAVLDYPATVNQDIKAITCISPNLSKFIYWAIKANENLILKDFHKDGTTVDSIDFEKFKYLSIPLPPIKEQEKIISSIELMMGLITMIDNSKEDIINVISIAKSKILELAVTGKLVPQNPDDEPAAELLKRINPKAEIITDNGHYPQLPDSWVMVPLKDICEFLSRGKSPVYADGVRKYPVYAQKCNLKEGGISLKDARFLDPATLGRWDEKYKLRNGDVLINSTGTGTVGRTRLFNESCLGGFPFVVPDSHVSVVRTYKEVVSEYVYAVLSSDVGQTYLMDNLSGSTNQKELYINTIGAFNFPLPPIDEQKRIVAKIEELFSILEGIKEALQA